MKIVDDIRNYAKEHEFKLLVKDNLINILNYEIIDVMDSNIIVIRTNSKKVKINGKSLKVNKLLNDEILAFGNISSITFEDIND